MHQSRHFKRTAWQSGELSSVLSDLIGRFHAKGVKVKTTGITLNEPATGDIRDVYDVTELPVGHNVVMAQYERKPASSDSVSNMDVLSVDTLSIQTVSVVFSSTDNEYQVDILTGNGDLTKSAFEIIIGRLALEEVV